MNILYTCDNNYVWLMGISVVSLFENNVNIKDLTVYLLGEKISDQNKNLISGIAKKYSRDIKIINVPEFDIPIVFNSSRWPKSAYIRLVSSQLLPDDLDKILYIDCDTVVNGNLEEIDCIDVSNKIVYGVKDCIGKSYRKNLGVLSESIYINAGVLLLNLKRLRKINVSDLISDFLLNYGKQICYADQDILNGIFSEEIGVLHPKYNVTTIVQEHSLREIQILRRPVNFYNEELSDAIKQPIIIHYTTNMNTIRPWFLNATHSMTNLFLNFMKISPWADRELETMTLKSNEYKIIYWILKLPQPVAYRILGFVHSEFKPFYLRIKSKRRMF